MRYLKMKRFWLGTLFLLFAGLLSSCAGTRILMQQAPYMPKGVEASPPINIAHLDRYKADLQEHIFGEIPDLNISWRSPSRVLATEAFNGSAHVEEISLIAGYGDDDRAFHLLLVTPVTDRPVPIIMMQNFCPNHSVIPLDNVTRPNDSYFNCDTGFMSKFFTYFFGRYITTPPVDAIMERGYALAVMFPHEFVPDDREGGLVVLGKLFPNAKPNKRPGALAAWASQFIAIADILDEDPRYSEIITYGHSRFGKTALVAAAFDDTIDGVIAHQSGTGGASLLKDNKGESIKDITTAYPHWFGQNFGNFADDPQALPIDAHHLIALVAPRPLLLGNARRDVWSDPNGAFRAAQSASAIYGEMGSSGMAQESLKEFEPKSRLSFWMRPGTHGVVKEDWPAFLGFLDAHFK